VLWPGHERDGFVHFDTCCLFTTLKRCSGNIVHQIILLHFVLLFSVKKWQQQILASLGSERFSQVLHQAANSPRLRSVIGDCVTTPHSVLFKLLRSVPRMAIRLAGIISQPDSTSVTNASTISTECEQLVRMGDWFVIFVHCITEQIMEHCCQGLCGR